MEELSLTSKALPLLDYFNERILKSDNVETAFKNNQQPVCGLCETESNLNDIVKPALYGNPFKFVFVRGMGASGASGKIEKAYCRTPGLGKSLGSLTPVAVKRMNWQSLSDDPEDFATLLNREKFALHELCAEKTCSPFLTKYYGSFFKPELDEHWLVFEYCGGGTVACLTDMPVNFKQLAAVTVGILKGLEAIHAQGFIHADIKPENVLLCYPGFVKICDFGLAAKVRDVDNPEYHALGTVRYMSPELMLKNVLLDKYDPRAEDCEYDYKTDIWSLGIVLLEILIGQVPLKALRVVEEEIFCKYILRMADEKKDQNKGSGLYSMFYCDAGYKKVVKQVLSQDPNEPLCDKTLLLHRVPALQKHKNILPQLLFRGYMHDKTPDPRREVPKLRKHGLFQINKCLDFIAQCLFSNYLKRPDAKALQNHSFVLLATKEMNKLMPDMEEIAWQYKSYRGRKTIWKDYRCPLTIRQIHDVIKKCEQVEKKKHVGHPLPFFKKAPKP